MGSCKRTKMKPVIIILPFLDLRTACRCSFALTSDHFLMEFILRTCLICPGSWVQPHTPMFSPTSLFRGDVDSATEVLEEVFTSPDSTSPSISFVFRKIFEENNDNAIDKCKKLKFARHSKRCVHEKANPASKLNVDAAVLQWVPWLSDWPTISPATDQPQTSSCCS